MASRARTVIVGSALCALLFAVPSAAETRSDGLLDTTQPRAACIPADQCCRICSAGKACGNSCIQASKTCHKGRGCSCNESELCQP
jgi:hypothetical protein